MISSFFNKFFFCGRMDFRGFDAAFPVLDIHTQWDTEIDIKNE